MDLIPEYLNYIELNKLFSKNSLRFYKCDLLDFESYCSQNLDSFEIQNLNTKIINDFIEKLKQKGNSVASINRKLTALHGFWIWLRNSEIVSKDPFLQIKRQAQYRNSKAKYLNLEQIQKILDHPEHSLKTKLILELIYATGIRVAELLNLTLDDIDLKNRIFTIARYGRFKERAIPFNQKLHNYIVEYIKVNSLKSNSRLLLNRWGESVSAREIFRILREAAKASGLEIKLSPSILRNSFLKHMSDNGAHEFLLRDLTGQKISKDKLS